MDTEAAEPRSLNKTRGSLCCGCMQSNTQQADANEYLVLAAGTTYKLLQVPSNFLAVLMRVGQTSLATTPMNIVVVAAAPTNLYHNSGQLLWQRGQCCLNQLMLPPAL